MMFFKMRLGADKKHNPRNKRKKYKKTAEKPWFKDELLEQIRASQRGQRR